MARPTSKKVSRAAQTGGGRTKGGARPWLYWLMIVVVVAAGSVGVVVSRDERRDELAAADTNVPPLVQRDHWHAAYGIYLCDRFVAPITDQRDPEGIHTHGDGVIHIHPTVRRAAGKNATLSKFADAIRMDLSDVEIDVPGEDAFREGDDECNGKPGVMKLKVKGQQKEITTDIADFRFTEDRMVITIAFVAEDTDIPAPLSEPNLDNLSDVPSTSVPVSIPEGTTEGSTPPPAEPTDTTAPQTTETTTAP